MSQKDLHPPTWHYNLLGLMIDRSLEHAALIIDLDGSIASWSQGAKHLLGFDDSEIIGRPFLSLFTAQDRLLGLPHLRMAAALSEGTADAGGWYRKKDAAQLWLNGKMILLKDQNDDPRAFGALLHEGDEKNRYPEAIGGAKTEFDRSLNEPASREWKWQFRKDEWGEGTVTLEDGLRDALSLNGSARSPVPLADLLSAIHLEDREMVRGEIQRCYQNGDELLSEFRVEWPVEGVRWLRAQGRTTVDSSGQLPTMEGTCADITGVKEIAVKQQEADRKKDEFLAHLAHELRNPLAPLRNGLQIMRLTQSDSSAFIQARTMMERQLTHIVRLIDDLEDVTLMTRKALRLERSRVLLADVLARAAEAARAAIDAGGHELTIQIPPEPIFLDGDLARLSQVFSNLLINSAQYTPRCGILNLTVECRASEAVIIVRDTGIGIRAESLPTIFEVFAQANRGNERPTGGLGTGLALVKGLVESHGGTVRAESAGTGQGSAFIVTLPTHDTRPLSRVHQPQGEKTAVKEGRRVLVVDDNRDSASSMAMMFKLLNNDVQMAHDGLEAIEKAKEFLPQIILMDLGMPRMGGLEATRRIRQHPWGQAMTIIALTGWGWESDKNRSADAGCDGHLVKPVDFLDLEQLLDRLARKKTPNSPGRPGLSDVSAP